MCVFLSPFLKFHVFEAAIYANKEVYNNIRVPIEGGVIRRKSLKYASACKRVFCITSGLAPSSGIVCRLAVDETGQSSRENRTQVAHTHTHTHTARESRLHLQAATVSHRVQPLPIRLLRIRNDPSPPVVNTAACRARGPRAERLQGGSRR